MKLVWLLFGISISYSIMSAQENSIVIIVPSYNNMQWYKKNLDSICQQQYGNYRVIYIDDCSTDGTGNAVERYVQDHHLQECVHVIHNPVRRGALANLYDAIHTCSDDTIIVTVDGDDWLATHEALSVINAQYQDEKVWMTYGQFVVYPDAVVGFCRALPKVVVQKNLFREYQWVTSHPRTFYAGLFKHVRYEDLLYEGAFFDVSWDQAFMFPMLEMAREHVRFIPDILYVYNQDNELNDFKCKTIRQIKSQRYIIQKEKYNRVASYAGTA